MFGDVFGDGMGESSVQGFRADTPRNRGVVTKKFNIIFSGIIVNFGFDSGGGERGGRRGSPGPGEDFQIEFRDVKMSVLPRKNLRVFV